MNGIYIESDKIQKRKDIVEWLDECGVVWAASKHTFAAFTNITQPFIEYVKLWDGFVQCDEPFTDSTHCQTPEQFCELIAESLGIDKPVFGEPIKGMAIEVSRLSGKERLWLQTIRKHPIDWNTWKYINYSGSELICADFPYLLDCKATDSPKVFMEYVEQQTGKEYNPERGYNPKEGLPPNLGTNEAIESYKNKIRQEIQHQSEAPYPHKTYRILDSLDGIPLDTRFKLSEWIPPMNSRAEVIAIASQDLAYHGYYKHLQGDCITFHSFKLNGELILPLDGEWMRIV